MSNWKHTALAVLSVTTVIAMTAVQYSTTFLAMADKAENITAVALRGDGDGEAPEFEEYDLAKEEPEVKTGYIIYEGGSVNVRAEEAKTSDIVASLEFADSFEVTNTSDDGLWCEVKLSDGTVGYVMSDLITFDYNDIKRAMISGTMYLTAEVSVSGGKLNVRNKPADTASSVIDQLKDKEIVYISEITSDEWVRIIFGKDYDTGYVKASYLSEGEMVQRADIDNARKDRIDAISKRGTIVTNVSAINVRNAPSEYSDAIGNLKNGENCTIISQGSKWTKIAYNDGIAYIISSAVMDDVALRDYNAKKEQSARRAGNTAIPAPDKVNTSKGEAIIAEGKKYIGTKYVYGGTSPSGFDCSGFVQYVMKNVGITVGRSSRDQYKNGVAVARENLAVGDLVFFSKGGSISHVGIYAGGGQVLHSPSPGKTVTYTALDHMCSYSTYVGARRVY